MNEHRLVFSNYKNLSLEPFIRNSSNLGRVSVFRPEKQHMHSHKYKYVDTANTNRN